jgi:hypothetical protein
MGGDHAAAYRRPGERRPMAVWRGEMPRVRRSIIRALAVLLLPASWASVASAASGAQGAADQDSSGLSSTPGFVGRSPVRLGTGYGPDVTVDPHGNVTVVWSTDWWQGPIKASTHPAGGHWTRPVTIGHGIAPQVVVDDQGTTTVAWQTNRRNRTTGVSVARHRLGGTWTTPRHLTSDTAAPRYWRPDDEGIFGASQLDLAVGATGSVVATWAWGSYHRDVPLRIQAADKPAGTSWRDTVRLSARNWSSFPSVAVDETGDALVAFGRELGDLEVRRLVDEAWTPSAVVDSAVGKSGLAGWRVAASDAAGMTVAYKRGTDSYGTMFASTLTSAGVWAAPEQLSGTDVGAWQVTALADRLGTTTVSWSGMYGRMDAVRRSAAGAWSSPTELLALHGWPDAPSSTTNADGDVLLSWFRYDVGVQARWIPAGGDWSGPLLVVPTPTAVALHWATALYPDGDVAAVWQPDRSSGPVRFLRVTPAAAR